MCAAYGHLLMPEDHDLSLLTRPKTQIIDLQLPPDRFSADIFENLSFEIRHEIPACTVPNARQRLLAQGELAMDDRKRIDPVIHEASSSEEAPPPKGESSKTLSRPNWRPWPMRSAYQSILTIVSLAMAVGQEVLYQYSNRNNGLFSFQYVSQITTSQWFLWRYFPTMIVVLYGMGIQTLDHQVMRLDPFYKLARPRGLGGQAALLRDPVNYFTYIRHPIEAGPRVWTSAFMTMLALIAVPPIQSASISTKILPTDKILPTHNNVSGTVYVHSSWSRCLTALFIAIACCTVILQVLLRAPSGLSANPDGIAGIAGVMIGGNVLQRLEGLSADPNDSEITSKLARGRYHLRDGCIWQSFAESTMPSISDLQKLKPQRLVLSTPLMTMLLILGLLLAVLTPVLNMTPARVVVAKTPWLPTAFAVSYKMLWGQFEVHIRTTEPYWHLCCGRAPGSTLAVDYTSLPTPALGLRALANGHLGLALIGFNSMLAEVLVVCAASLYDNEASGTVSFSGFWYPFGIIIAMCVVMSGSMGFLWFERRRTWLPRAPGSIASIVVYLYMSKMLDDFNNMHRLSPRERASKLKARSKTYSLGWFDSGLGKHKLRIDEEPRIAKYFPPGYVDALPEETVDRNSACIEESPLNERTSQDS
jgi:Protein of unknown function (DUF3433)